MPSSEAPTASTAAPNRRSSGHRVRILYTTLLYLTNICYGLMTVTSSTLIDIAEQTGSTTALVSTGFSVRLIVYCASSVLQPKILDSTGPQVGTIICLIIMSAATAVVPFAPSIHYFWASQALLGFALTGIDIATIAWIYDMWQSGKANSVMQGFYLCLSVGIMASSLIAAPFLSKNTGRNDKAPVNGTIVDPGNDSAVIAATTRDSRIIFPYLIIAAFVAMVAGSLLIANTFQPYRLSEKKTPVMKKDGKSGDEEEERPMKRGSSVDDSGDMEVKGAGDAKCQTTSRRSEVLVLFSGFLLMGSLASGNFVSNNFLPTFAFFSHLKLEKEEAAVMASIMSGAAAAALLAATYIATRVSAENMLFAGCTMFFTGNVMLLMAERLSQPLLILPAIVMLGVGDAPSGPNAYSFMAQQMKLTNSAIGFLTASRSVFRSVVAFGTGLLIESLPVVYIGVNVTATVISISVILYFHCRAKS